MTPWTRLDVDSADGARSELFQRGAHYSIRVNGELLMNSRVHGSERALADLALDPLTGRPGARVLVAGLGFGYTLSATLGRLGADARVIVSEISPAVVRWNRELLGALNGRALDDPRVEVSLGDVCDWVRSGAQTVDAILLDVDNGPRAVGRESNAWLYSPLGLAALRERVAPGGVVAVWSAGPEVGFSERLRAARFSVVLHRVASHAARTRERHFIWVAAAA